MEFKKLISAALMIGAMSFGATTASAQSSFMSGVNSALGTAYNSTTDCVICHSSASNFAGDKGVKLLAAQYKAGGITATSDSDGDGYTDKQEANATYDFNFTAITPFTRATTAATIADSALTNFVVTGDNTAVAQAFTDTYSLAGAGTVMAGESLTINNPPLNIYIKGLGVTSSDKIYILDSTGNGTLAVVNTDYTLNNDGSINITAFGTGITTITGIVVDIPTAGSTGGGGGGGCVTASATTPLMMLFAMLTLGFFVRRKKD